MLTTNQEIKYARVSLETPVDIEKFLKDAIIILDKHGEKYKHSVPWKDEYCADPKFYSYRVKIGAVGRIVKCKHAIEIGLNSDVNMATTTFVSLAHFRVYRFTRAVKRLEIYADQIATFINVSIGENARKHQGSVFTNMDW